MLISNGVSVGGEEKNREHLASLRKRSRSGFFYGLAAHAIWGVVPLYFHALADVPPWIVLCHRVIWSVAFVALIISVRKEWRAVGLAMACGRNLALLTASAGLIAFNWLLFIYAISTRQALQASLGYFINPLFSVALGTLLLGERLRPWQWIAVGVATAAVVNLSVRGTGVPWLALGLASSFSLYGLVRKRVDVDSLHGLMIESLLLLAPAAMALMFAAKWDAWRMKAGLLSLSGIITAIPLLLFGAAVRRLRLSTMGFVQYIGPTLQFLVALLIFREPLDHARLISFSLCWVAIAIYTADMVHSTSRAGYSPAQDAPSDTAAASE